MKDRHGVNRAFAIQFGLGGFERAWWGTDEELLRPVSQNGLIAMAWRKDLRN